MNVNYYSNCTVAVLEDNRETLNEIEEALSVNNYNVVSSSSASEFVEKIEGLEISLYLLDLGLPDADGLNFVRELRRINDAGIIIISGRSSETDRVVGLELGADDYIAKPFSPRELCARVSSVLRRVGQPKVLPTSKNEGAESKEVLRFSEWKLDTRSHQLFAPNGEQEYLTNAEYSLLYVFLNNQNRALTRDALINQLKGQDWAGYDRAMDGLVSRLRKKLAKFEPDKTYIRTVHGVGYLFSDNS
ncbi:response regulator transcription factor [Actibacterium pelagium]|uniref:DNA-binding response regulator n=1 Tax=Actibacterium pelagium TaxID=2029103 RepID=A0A917EN09_9RHOB|nr:response regulator transcription factor [Actibacterium pelagium]GGE62821.1 DNA-binding response regulator [Actibacterium pelagium]